jgi:hypothetical protein
LSAQSFPAHRSRLRSVRSNEVGFLEISNTPT